MMTRLTARWRRQEGAALIETAFTLPLLLFISISILEFGRAFQTFQVVTNAAREGARVAVLPGTSDGAVTDRVQAYLAAGNLPLALNAKVEVARNTTVSLGTATATASRVKVEYPFTFMVLQPLAQLVVKGSTVGGPVTISSAATMRNE